MSSQQVFVTFGTDAIIELSKVTHVIPCDTAADNTMGVYVYFVDGRNALHLPITLEAFMTRVQRVAATI